MSRGQVPIQFPFKGINKTAGSSALPPGFSKDVINILPYSSTDKRIRGSKRPGTSRAIAEALPGPVQRMTQVTLAADSFIDPENFFTDPLYDAGSGQDGLGSGGGFLRPKPPYYHDDEHEWPADDDDVLQPPSEAPVVSEVSKSFTQIVITWTEV